MKQTAVEWLQETWGNYPDLCTWEKIQEWFEQAKQMELKAKETLYTEDDIDKIFSYYKNGAPAYYIKNTYKKYLQSLKQPKQ